MRWSARAALLAAVAVSGLVSAPSAQGLPPGPGIDIDHVEVVDDQVSVLLGTDRLPLGSEPDLDGVVVRIGEDSVTATAVPVSSGEVRRTTVLALDTSLSMRGARLDAARAAARAFLEAAPGDVRVGLISFSADVREVVAPTTDHDAVASAIDDLRLTRGTHVYDAVARAVTTTGEAGARSVLLLSDGLSTGGRVTLREATRAATDDGVVVDVVALDQGTAARATLGRIATTSGGDVVGATDRASLARAFTDQAEALGRQVLVQFQRPEGAPDEAVLEVTVPTSTTEFSDSAFVALPGAAPVERTLATPKALVGPRGLLLGSGALGLGLAAILAIVMLGGPGSSAAQRRIGTYLGETAPERAVGVRQSAVAVADRVVTADVKEWLVRRLAGAGMSVTPAEWALFHAGVIVVASAVGMVLGGVVLSVLALLGGAVLPVVYLRHRHATRLAAFGAQLAETLGLMAGGLSAGLSLPQAVDTVVREGHEPMAGELRRTLVEHRLGVDIEDALESVADRMGSEDFGWVVMAVRIQREVGGNLSEILHTVADTLREREYLRRQVRTLSAEGRLSAWILGSIPVFMFFYMLFANRSYVSMLYTETTGLMMLSAAVGLLGTGAWFMSRLVKVAV